MVRLVASALPSISQRPFSPFEDIQDSCFRQRSIIKVQPPALLLPVAVIKTEISISSSFCDDQDMIEAALSRSVKHATHSRRVEANR